MDLITKLKYALLEKDLKSKELAELMDADEAQVSQWVNGKRKPSLLRAIQIAKVLGMHVEDLWELVE